jgi:tetrapyrrole methylase family protein/MazG family protein
MPITIVGLGPGDPGQLTRQAWQVLEAADEVYLRTRKHPTVSALPGGLTLHSFDHLYEGAADFGVGTAPARRGLRRARSSIGG